MEHTPGGGATTSLAHPTGKISYPYLLAASLLVGLGLFSAMMWLVTMAWLWFLLFIPALVFGALMLFSERAGLDRAV